MNDKSLKESITYLNGEGNGEDADNPMGETRGKGRPVKGRTRALTWAEETFARYVAQGITLTESYRRAYPVAVKWTAKAAADEGSKTAKRPLVAARIAKLRTEMAEQGARQVAITSVHMREHVRIRLYAESTNAPESSARIKALELLGKMSDVNLFGEQRDEVKRDDSTEIEKQLRQALHEAFPALASGGTEHRLADVLPEAIAPVTIADATSSMLPDATVIDVEHVQVEQGGSKAEEEGSKGEDAV